MKKALISIIIVTYNAEKHLDPCLIRIREQQISDLQVIIIDGGSTDGTLGIIDNHASLIDYWKSEPDKGIYDAMNKGVKIVNSGWILFLGADDLLEDGFKSMVSELKDPKGIYYGMVDVNGLIYKGPYSSYRLSKLNICHQSIFYPVSVFSEKHKYNLDYPIWADWYLNIECWNDPDFKFIYKPYLISKFGTQGLSSTQMDHAFERERKKIIFKYLGFHIWFRYNLRTFKRKIFR